MQLLGRKPRAGVLQLVAQTRTISFVNAGRKMVQDLLVPPCFIQVVVASVICRAVEMMALEFGIGNLAEMALRARWLIISEVVDASSANVRNR